MEAVAIIVEYNPLHNGHLYHLQETKKHFPDAIIIAILNGDFLQRGEPAILDKYYRTKWALQAGVDLVVELPFAFGTQRADIFAKGAIQIADGLGAAAIVYGSEQQADADTPLEMLQPNEKLAHFYQAAIAQINPDIEAIAIGRQHAAYHQATLEHETIASATALREKIQNADIDDIAPYVPPYVFSDIKQQKVHLANIAQYFPYLQYSLVQQNDDTLALAQSGLAASIRKALETSESFEAFFAKAHHKHTSKTHIQRALTYHVTQTSQAILDQGTVTSWTRILGASAAGKKYLKYIKQKNQSALPLIAKMNDLASEHYQLQYASLIAYANITNTSIQQALVRANSKDIITL